MAAAKIEDSECKDGCVQSKLIEIDESNARVEGDGDRALFCKRMTSSVGSTDMCTFFSPCFWERSEEVEEKHNKLKKS